MVGALPVVDGQQLESRLQGGHRGHGRSERIPIGRQQPVIGVQHDGLATLHGSVADARVPHREGDGQGPHGPRGAKHGRRILRKAAPRVEGEECRDAFRSGACGHHLDRDLGHHPSGLLRGETDAGVVRQDDDLARPSLADGRHELARRGGLPAAHDGPRPGVLHGVGQSLTGSHHHDRGHGRREGCRRRFVAFEMGGDAVSQRTGRAFLASRARSHARQGPGRCLGCVERQVIEVLHCDP